MLAAFGLDAAGLKGVVFEGERGGEHGGGGGREKAEDRLKLHGG